MDFFFATVSGPGLGFTQLPLHWVLGALSLVLKWQRRETDVSPLSTAEVKNGWSCASTPQYIFMAWCSVKQQTRLHDVVFS